MIISTITRPNRKGQIVLPKNVRKALGIDSNVALNISLRGGGIYIHPVEEVITNEEKESSYLDILLKTQGSWRTGNWNKVRSGRHLKEIQASSRRKRAW